MTPQWFSTYQNFKSTKSAQKIVTTVFWYTHGVILLDFLQHCTAISESYVATLKKLKETITRKRTLKDVHFIKLHHNNAWSHTSYFTTKGIEKMGLSVVPNPPYSPQLSPSNFYLFGPMKQKQRSFINNDFKSALKSQVKKPEIFRNDFNA